VKKGAQNELTGIHFDIFGGQIVHKGGAKLDFSGHFVTNCRKGSPNCDAPWLMTKKGHQLFERLKKFFPGSRQYTLPSGADTPSYATGFVPIASVPVQPPIWATGNSRKVSLILLATNSKMGIFGIFSTVEPKFVTFKTGILEGPAIKVTTNVNLKTMTIECCAVDKNESVSHTFWQ